MRLDKEILNDYIEAADLIAFTPKDELTWSKINTDQKV